MCGVERDRTRHIVHLISNTVFRSFLGHLVC
jgi:hypothetical protein